MINPGGIDLARGLAQRLHAGQVDKAGQPYIQHLERVLAHLLRLFPDATTAQAQAALLHDSIEDAGTTEGSLITAGIEPEAARIMRQVTRPAGSIYLDWIGDIVGSGDVGAMRVKLADNLDNSDEARPAIAGGEEMRRTRYAPARVALEQGLGLNGEVAGSLLPAS